MPYAICNNCKIYYEISGHRDPLLLISGLGGGTWSWYGQVPYFQNHYSVITFDNRGAGRSCMPPGPYMMIQLARDALNLLEELNIDEAFVMGLSMGGMIAQELALLAPRRVRALVLGCTHCGGSKKIGPQPDVLSAFIDNHGLSQEQVIDKNLPFFFSERCLREDPETVKLYRDHQLQGPMQPESAFQAQLEAIRTFDCCDRLELIQAPTLVVAGTEDLLVPFENARILAQHIPNAEIVELTGAGHALHAECRDKLNQIAHEFFVRAATKRCTSERKEISQPQ